MLAVWLFVLWIIFLRFGWVALLFLSFKYRAREKLSNRLLTTSLVWGVISVGEWVITNFVLPYVK